MIWKPGEYKRRYPDVPDGRNWNSCSNPLAMLDGFVRARSHGVRVPRLRRLLAVACCRSACEVDLELRTTLGISAGEPRSAIELALNVAERYADRLVPNGERLAAQAKLQPFCGEKVPWGPWADEIADAAWICCSPDSWRYTAQPRSCGKVYQAERTLDGQCIETLESVFEQKRRKRYGNKLLKVYSDLIRDIFGNPFVTVSLNTRCLTTTTRALATFVYDSRCFDNMPIIGDALEESGCVDETILNHCRQPGMHVRGCWVVDLVLGFRKPVNVKQARHPGARRQGSV